MADTEILRIGALNVKNIESNTAYDIQNSLRETNIRQKIAQLNILFT